VYARITTLNGDPDRIEQTVALALERVRPVVEGLAGSLGLAVFADRQTGQVVATTAWSSEEARAASDAALAPLRVEAAHISGGAGHVDLLEFALVERMQRAAPGCWARSTRVQVDAAAVDRAVTRYREQVLPRLKTMPGFCSGVLLIDRATGAGVGTTTWASREALEASRPTADMLRAQATSATGSTVVEVTEHVGRHRRPARDAGRPGRSSAAVRRLPRGVPRPEDRDRAVLRAR
jgi:heme-degrading monooxygenase HmoA